MVVLPKGEKPPFRCAGCGERVLMGEEHVRQQAKKLEKKPENQQDPS